MASATPDYTITFPAYAGTKFIPLGDFQGMTLNGLFCFLYWWATATWSRPLTDFVYKYHPHMTHLVLLTLGNAHCRETTDLGRTTHTWQKPDPRMTSSANKEAERKFWVGIRYVLYYWLNLTLATVIYFLLTATSQTWLKIHSALMWRGQTQCKHWFTSWRVWWKPNSVNRMLSWFNSYQIITASIPALSSF